MITAQIPLAQSKSPLKGKKQYKNVKSRLFHHEERPKFSDPQYEEYNLKMQQKMTEIKNDQLKGKITFEESIKRINKLNDQMKKKFHNQMFGPAPRVTRAPNKAPPIQIGVEA